MKTLIFKLIAICILYQANAQTCNKPNTVCKKIQDCPKLHSLFKPSMTQEDRQTLKEAKCGHEEYSPKVCCPEPVPVCQTPEGKEGECKSIYDCPHILEKLQTKIPEKINYVGRSICNGSAKYSVCCGPDPELAEEQPLPLATQPVSTETECCGKDGGIKMNACRLEYWMKYGAKDYIMSRLRHKHASHYQAHHHDDFHDHHHHDYHDFQESCSAPNTECKSIRECPPLLKLLKPSITAEQRQLLSNSMCGISNNSPQVCCPFCVTPDGQRGECVDIYSCQHILDMLRSKDDQKLTFVRNSRCNGDAKVSVCCGPEPIFQPQPMVPLVAPTGECTSSVMPPDPETGCCGIEGSAGNKIFGGTETTVDQYPWMALIEYVKDGQTKLLCGAALISGRYVLSAAHCVVGAVLEIGTPRNVRLGEHDTSHANPDCLPAEGGGEDCNEELVIIRIQKIIAHENYNPAQRSRRNDIALIRLSQTAPYTDFIRPICLPTADFAETLSADTQFYVAGWGAINETFSKSNVKIHVDVPLVSREDCQESYASGKRTVELWEGQLCAGGEPGKDSCKGDSGGPLMYENKRRFELVGIVSFGPTPCGMEDIPGVYSYVHYYLPWINSKMTP